MGYNIDMTQFDLKTEILEVQTGAFDWQEVKKKDPDEELIFDFLTNLSFITMFPTGVDLIDINGISHAYRLRQT